ncbi:glucosaminylphosphatidylinositol acyltransferase [Nematocida homosporus]|uniref:glucosaminylphosphatidylinositol acyltransferase n=1 Tax=Nematocida homosporus TaxID=1912981 RepID=UPI00221F3DA9|nr:glucosaminylphosphatidylinositol acyltransferase [Nematocida homosporus]KAI5184292.1 glucosaminylphosphatidylinositol acyltransferase [Nematocida homosporus]
MIHSNLISRTELLHSTCSAGYWMYLAHGLGIRNRWILLIGWVLVHYLVTISRDNSLLWGLFGLAVGTCGLGIVRQGIRPGKKRKVVEVDARELVNSLRFTICSLVCISIFTCDFAIYPEWKKKSLEFGISLMDFGVAAFMVNAGVLAAIRHRFRPLKGVYLLVMGLMRLGVLKSGYHAEPTEYGTELNFYFIYLACEVLGMCLRWINSWVVAGVLLLGHEWLVWRPGVVQFVFYGARDGWWQSNREGLLSIVPYTGMLFLGKGVGEVIFDKRLSGSRKSLVLGTLAFGLLGVHWVSGMYLGPSRRLCSLAFSSFVCAAMVLPMSAHYLAGSIWDVPMVCPFPRLSQLFGPLFLLSNAYVLIGNLCFNWLRLSVWEAHAANLVYLVALFLVPLWLLAGPKTS